MYQFNPEQFTAAGKDAAADFSNLALTAYAGFEKLTDLNLATSKALLNDSLGSLQAAASAKTPQEALAAQSELARPLAEKAATYGRTVYEIASQTNAELAKVSQGKMGGVQQTFSAAMESLAKNVPAGGEAFAEAFKNMAATGQKFMDSAQAATKQAMTQAQTQVTDVVAKATKTTSKGA
ncbi:MAG: TIGR01841 family phasin [Burkholderiaceae bacterium]|nr:TIGR01841 family phasin [Burkholderiaceae bacterium]